MNDLPPEYEDDSLFEECINLYNNKAEVDSYLSKLKCVDGKREFHSLSEKEARQKYLARIKAKEIEEERKKNYRVFMKNRFKGPAIMEYKRFIKIRIFKLRKIIGEMTGWNHEWGTNYYNNAINLSGKANAINVHNSGGDRSENIVSYFKSLRTVKDVIPHYYTSTQYDNSKIYMVTVVFKKPVRIESQISFYPKYYKQ